jgi:chaperone modulatory protein CbpM
MSDVFHFLDADTEISFEELLRSSGLPQEALCELIDIGAFDAHQSHGAMVFTAHCIVRGRQAARLREDFDLDAGAIALALAYLDRIDTLETRIRELECLVLK